MWGGGCGCACLCGPVCRLSLTPRVQYHIRLKRWGFLVIPSEYYYF